MVVFFGLTYSPRTTYWAWGFLLGLILGFGSLVPLPVLAQSTANPSSAEEAFVLALTWQPAFCETRTHLPECASQHPERADARALSLHGLWPQPRGTFYCGVPKSLERIDKRRDWLDLPRLPLSDDLRRRLESAMPGMMSGLHRHEWIKHGTCAGWTPEGYFAVSLAMQDLINNSPVGALLADRIGDQVSRTQLARAMDQAFGAGAGERLEVICAKDDAGQRMIRELRISLGPIVEGEGDLGEIIRSAPPVENKGCRDGRVDPV
ncbi:MAG: ribonuclease T2 family protein [Rhodospirillaceae bacterium]